MGKSGFVARYKALAPNQPTYAGRSPVECAGGAHYNNRVEPIHSAYDHLTMQPLFTPGAERAMQMAALLAQQSKASAIEPLHLLCWAPLP